MSKGAMSFGVLSIVLSLVFVCLMLALGAQLYYFLCWKKRKSHLDIEVDQGNYNTTTKGLFYWVCRKKACNIHATKTIEQENASHESHDLELSEGKGLLLKSSVEEEEGLDSELIRLHNLAGPPRFLFTITEETKDDLESEDRSRKGSRTRSLSDVMLTIDTPFLTPLASSPLKYGLDNHDSYKHQGFNNPLFEASRESEFNRFRSSPPPKFKFLRDAEEKLYRKLMEESIRKAIESNNHGSVTSDESFVRIIQKKDMENKQLQQCLPQFPSSSSQVLPLASSPTTFKPLENASMVH